MKILKTKKFYFIILLIFLTLYLVYAKFIFKPAIKYTTAPVELGTLKQTVTETGTIKRVSEVSLNFLSPGRLATSSVKVGARVKKGQILAELDYTNLKIQARQAEANLDVSKANAQKILNGATVQDLNIGQTGVNQAQVALASAKKDLSKSSESDQEAVNQAQKNYHDLTDKLTNTPAEASVVAAQASLDKNKITYLKIINNRIDSLLVAVHDKISVSKNSLDNVNRILTDDNAKDTLSVKNPSQLTQAKNSYDNALILDNNCNLLYSNATQSKNANDVKAASDAVTDYLTKSIIALNDTFAVLEQTVVSIKFTQLQMDSFKSTISGQISLANAGLSALEQAKQALDDASNSYDSAISSSEQNLNIAQANLSSAQTQALNVLNTTKLAQTRNLQSAKSRVDSSQEALKLAQAQLNKTASNTRPEDIALVQAQIKQAQANLDGVKNQISNSIIIAPFDGQITQANYDVGEEPTAAKPVFVLMGEKQFEIDVDIAESDIAKVALGNRVSIDFDAFGSGIIFTGSVDLLDPAQTIIQEVVYYKGTIGHIDTSSSTESYLAQIKPGMTSNITIMAKQKDNVLIVPFRAVTDSNGQRTVDVLRDGQSVTLPVSLGLRGDDGLVEVVSGLSAGEKIILSHTP